MRWRIVVILLCLNVSLLRSQEDESAWWAVLFDTYSGTLTTVDAEMVVSSQVVTEFAEDLTGTPVLSPDGRDLVFVSLALRDDPARLRIADVEGETCCRDLPDPLEDGTTIIGSSMVFNADALAAVFLNDETNAGVIAVVNLTGDELEVTATLDLNDVFPERQPRDSVIFHQWNEDGIVFAQMSGMNRRPSSGFYVWSPESGDVEETDVVFEADTLSVKRCDHVQHPVEVDPNRQYGNSVVYTDAAGGINIVYHDASVAIREAAWGVNQDAILVLHGETGAATVIYRDGETVDIDAVDGEARIITGTPDGWLLSVPDDPQSENGRIVHLTMEDGEAVFSDIGETARTAYLLARSPLVSGEVFPVDGELEDGAGTRCPQGG